MAEIEVGGLARQCLNHRRLESQEHLAAEVAAWERERNAAKPYLAPPLNAPKMQATATKIKTPIVLNRANCFSSALVLAMTHHSSGTRYNRPANVSRNAAKSNRGTVFIQ